MTSTHSRRLYSTLLQTLKKKNTIETSELAALLSTNTPNLAILNATIPRRDYSPKNDHLQERIPHSVYLDFKGFCDPNTKLSYMMPDLFHFTKMMRSINVRKTDNVVIYDKYRNISAPRTWFMMKYFGLPNVWVLNGTFEKWNAEGRQIERGQSEGALWVHGHSREERTGDFEFCENKKKVKKFEDMQKLVEAKQNGDQTPLLDGRIAKYYHKVHIPTAQSLPLDHVMDPQYCFLNQDELIAKFKSVGVKDPLKDEVVFCCQRGITACIIEFALRSVGNENTSVYDGSLEEWAIKTGMELPKDH
ncbi:hypothetical protein FGO68_gene2944 [Halteria grandinella]|uniref:Rhodanese domain-containing protein n=1 Tax=Halteria grandinella TaxID=5974 RepID=A0A8J8SZP6_HALGN|nr:hypothetical protein FGO68_gene2944 [Halteria grandinella]